MDAVTLLLILVSSSTLGVVVIAMLALFLIKRRDEMASEVDVCSVPFVVPDSTPWHLETTDCIPIQPKIYEELQTSEDEDTQGLLKESSGISGKLEFSLQYDLERSMLLVTVHMAHGLQDGNRNDVTYYVTITILPQIHCLLQSTAVAGKDPVFQELFEFCVPYESLLEQQLKFSVMHFDRFSRHDFTGDVTVQLAELEHRGLCLSREILLLRKIDAVKKVNDWDFGELLFALTYFPLTERLNVDLLKAKDLQLGGDGRNPDPYVEVSLLDAGREVCMKCERTPTLKNIRNPTFNARLVFHTRMATLHKTSLLLSVMHDEQGRGEEKCLGQVFLGPEATGSQFEHWDQMRVTGKPVARWHKLSQLGGRVRKNCYC